MFICQILDLNHDFYDNFVESLFEIISLDKCQPFPMKVTTFCSRFYCLFLSNFSEGKTYRQTAITFMFPNDY